jgi:hypothetical protein
VIAELTASMQTNGQVAALELERLLTDVGFDEAKLELPRWLRPALAALAVPEQLGIAIEGQGFTSKELGRRSALEASGDNAPSSAASCPRLRSPTPRRASAGKTSSSVASAGRRVQR